MDDLISVIIPVYNVDDYLEVGLQSLLKQTYKNLQIILIDDGSTDNSGRICDLYKKRDKRIEVYHLRNQGVSNARNYGLECAKGKYIYFLDSDDFLEPQAIEILYAKMKKESADLVEFSYFKNYTSEKEKVVHPYAKISGEEAIRSLLLWNGYITSFCWDKLYIKEKIGDIRFDTDLKIGEDDLFVFKYLIQCDNVIVLEYPLYNYMIRNNSAIGSMYTRKKTDSVRAASIICDTCNKRNLLISEAKIHVGLVSFFSYANLLDTISYKKVIEFKDDCEFYTQHMKKCSFGLLNKYLGKKISILYKMSQYFPFLYKASGVIRKKSR